MPAREEIIPRLRRAFLLGGIGVVAIGLTFAGLTAAHRSLARRVLHSRDISRVARESHSLAADRHRGLEEFLISRRAESLRLEIAASSLLRTKVDSLIALTRDNVSQQERAKAIRDAIARWERGYAMPALAHAKKTPAPPAASEVEVAGAALFESLRASFDTFLAAEDRLHRRRVAAEVFLEDVAFWAVMLEVSLLLGVLVWLRSSAFRAARELIAKKEQLEEQATELEAQSDELGEQAAMLEEQTEAAQAVARSLEASNHELAETVARLEQSQEVAAGARKEKEETAILLDVVLEGSPIGLSFHDRQLRFTRINPALAAMSGQPAGDFIGRTPDEVRPNLVPPLEPIMKQVLATGKPVMNLAVMSPQRGDRTERHVTASFFPIRNAAGDNDGVGMVVLDATERKRLEEQLTQSQKMEAIGRLAGGVAHDFNNILTAITGYSELLLTDMAEGRPRREDVEEIREAAERASTLTRQLLAFSRQQILRPQVLDLNATVSELKNMLSRVIGADIELNTRLAPEIGMITADPGQIEQVLMNLMVNARDSMPDGGRMDIETANVELDEEYTRAHSGCLAGPYVMLAVSDTGHGMSKEVQARIFEPFFTTKDTGKGTGLGLSTVYGIVNQSGGHVWVYSEPDKGTTFKVYLPRVRGLPDREEVDQRRNARGGTETILLVEDEEKVRAVASRILRRNGYTVVEASNGAEAWRLCSSEDSQVDLIVTDMIMPEMGGFELASRVRAIRPGARILFTSGYTEDAMMRRSILDPGAAFLEKPFTPARLAQKAREILDAPEPVVELVAQDV
jgi:PAS domain S-box-containing protein